MTGGGFYYLGRGSTVAPGRPHPGPVKVLETQPLILPFPLLLWELLGQGQRQASSGALGLAPRGRGGEVPGGGGLWGWLNTSPQDERGCASGCVLESHRDRWTLVTKQYGEGGRGAGGRAGLELGWKPPP